MSGATDNRQGAALISALLLVALMSVVTLSLMTEIRFGLQRSANRDVRDQAHWYAVGGRDYAELLLLRAMDSPERVFRPDAAWLDGPQYFQIDEGQLAARIRDGSNCFNLNSLVSADGQGRRIGNESERRHFEALMTSLGLPAGLAIEIAAQATDWIDSDTRPMANGAESDEYARAGRSYRTSNALMSERDEVRALEVVTPQIYARLSPLICALPMTDPTRININTLTLDQADLLVGMLGGAITRAEAERILIERPASGFASIEAFWSHERVAALEIDPQDRPDLSLTSRFFEVRIDVRYHLASYVLTQWVDVRGASGLRRLSQRFGPYS